MTSPTQDTSHRLPLVLAITGASGALYAVRLLQTLSDLALETHLTISPSGAAVIEQELGITLNLGDPDLAALLSHVPSWSGDHLRREIGAVDWQAFVNQRVRYHRYNDYLTPIASGSFRTSAMVVCPCSGSTLSGIARAAASNLVQRAAEVHLKEQRKLVLVPRETPLSLLQIENMRAVAAAGGVILPAMPGWYHGVESPDSLIDFVVSRILDQVGLENTLIQRWKESP